MNITIKAVLIGDGAVGKTSLRERYLGRGFSANYMMTIGADFALKQVKLKNGDREQTINVQIWDLAGQVHFSKVRTLYYKGLKGLLAVFDVTRDTSYTNLLNWVNEIKSVVDDTSKIPIILIGNKIDLRIEGEPSHITPELGIKMADQFSELLSDGKLDVVYVETSAKTGENVEVAFNKLVETIVKVNS